MGTKSLETLAGVSARIRELASRRDAEAADEQHRLTEAVRQLASDLPRGRRAEFLSDEDVETDDALDFATREYGPAAGLKAMRTRPAKTDEQRAVQAATDDLYILRTLLRRDGQPVDVRRTRYFRRACAELPTLRKAFDTAAAADWIPEEMSAEIVRKVRLSLRVGAIFERVPMPTASYKVPVEGSDGVCYFVPEQGDSDADLDVSKRIPATLDPPGLTNAHFVAKKLGSRVTVSSEVTEDAIVPMLQHIKEKLVLAMATGQEDACLNGSTASPHFDGDVSAPTDRRKSIDGLRSHVVRNTFIGGQTIVTAATAGRLEIGDLRALRLKLRKYALTPGDAVLVTGPAGYNALLGLKDSNGNLMTTTWDKLGPLASLITGQVASLDGWPVVLSEYVREDLAHNAFYDGLTTDSTLVLLVSKRSFVWGDHRQPTLKVQDLPISDQQMLVSTQRLDFLSWYPIEPTVGYVRDVRI